VLRPLPAALAIFGLLFLRATSLCAQAKRPASGTSAEAPTGSLLSGGVRVVVTVTEGAGLPLSGPAIVRLFQPSRGYQQELATRIESKATFEGVPPGTCTIEVNTAGYKTARTETEILSSGTQFVEVKLTPDTGNSTAAAAGPPILAPKAQKELERGLTALKAGQLDEAKRHLFAAHKLAPGNPDVDFLLGILFLSSRNLGEAEPYLLKSTSLDPHNVAGLVALGELRLRQGNFAGAVPTLTQAPSLDEKNWRAYWLLASAWMNQREFEKARQEAERAIELGKNSAGGARLLLGEALAALRESKAAIRALQSYLDTSPAPAPAAAAQELIKKLESSAVATAQEIDANSRPAADPISPAGILPEAKLSVRRWLPPDVDEVRPPVAEGVSCPSERVLEGATSRVRELVSNLERFSATEDLLHENMDELGRPSGAETRRFNYLVFISEIRPGTLDVEEYRNGSVALEQFPAQMATVGLPALVLLFHPALREDFEMTCEGLEDWHGLAAWQVYFRQRADHPSRLESYRVNDWAHPVSLKGRVWIAAESFQVVRLEADLTKPMPEIDLLSEHQEVEYRPVKFKKNDTELWLPASAEIYWEFRHHRYHRRHSFRDYLLFSVEEKQKIGEPKQPGS